MRIGIIYCKSQDFRRNNFMYGIDYKDAVQGIFIKNDDFFTFILNDGMAKYIDYSALNTKFIWSEDLKTFDTGGEKEKISSISDLRKICTELVLEMKDIVLGNIKFEDVKNFLRKKYINNSGVLSVLEEEKINNVLPDIFDIKSEDTELLVNQLMFDILYDKYLEDTEMTLKEFCDEHFYYDYRGNWKRIKDFKDDRSAANTKNTIYKTMRSQIEKYIKIMSAPAKMEDLNKYVLDTDFYFEDINTLNKRFETTEKKPKWVWDLLYYNHILPAFKQFRRDFWEDNEESQRKYVRELNDYDKFVQTAFKPKEGDDRDYFLKSMSFYYLESISYLEYMYKLAERMERDGINNFDKYNLSVQQFYIDVSCPVVIEEDDYQNLYFIEKRNNYAPCLFITENWLHRSDYKLDREENNPFSYDTGINVVRAQAYELFKYHYKFTSDDYKEISEFIRTDYNVLDTYYKKDKIWNNIKEDEPISYEQEMRIKDLQTISNAVFKKVNKKYITEWLNSNNKKDENYIRIFGIDKENYEKLLSRLENAETELLKDGGRPPKLTVKEKFLITLEYEQYGRTMENIATDYGVGKRQISEAINWVDKNIAIYLEELWNEQS